MDGIILILGEMNFNTIKFQILCCDTSLLEITYMLKEQERLDDLIKENLKIIQNDEVFSFSTDALLLAHFTKVRKMIAF